MTPDLLKRCAAAYSPERGRTALASALGVTDRTIRRWLRGDTAIPANIADDLVRIMRDRHGQLREQARECNRLAAALCRDEAP